MSKNSKFMTRINRLPVGTTLKKRRYYEDTFIWSGKIIMKGKKNIEVEGPNLGTVVENLLILKRRRENETNTDN